MKVMICFRIPCKNNETNKNLNIPNQNHENYEIHKIQMQNHENHEKFDY